MKHALHTVVAVHVFDWRWLAFNSVPVRSAPGYPNKCIVRELFPPSRDLSRQWKEWFAENGGYQLATGEEPLSYSYCSSCGPYTPPTIFDDSAVMPRMKIIGKDRPEVWDRFVAALPPAHMVKRNSYSLAALKSLGKTRYSSPFAIAEAEAALAATKEGEP